MNPVFQMALPVLNKIEEAGFEAYFVGGSVRDFLLKREISDVDIATSATPDEIKNIFSRTIDVGIEHGTVIVLYEGQSYEVTTFRTESEYVDFRRPSEVFYVRSLIDDLKRRDFSMNAIAMNKDGEIIDPFHGIAAINQKEIRTVGKAEDRFQEDALRMMRAIRFVSQLSFTIEQSTYQGLIEYGHLLKNIAVERIAIEFEKLLLGGNHQEAIRILINTNLYQYLPGFEEQKRELSHFSQLQFGSQFSIEERWVILLHYLQVNPENVERFLRGWKQPVNKMKRIKKGLVWLRHRLYNDWKVVDIYTAQADTVISSEMLYNLLKGLPVHQSIHSLQQWLDSLPIKSRKELKVTGKDLINWYDLDGGPWLEEKLVEIEKAVLFGETTNSRESIREWLFKCNQI